MRAFHVAALCLVLLVSLVRADFCGQARSARIARPDSWRSQGVKVCGSGSIGCSNVCTIQQNGQTRYACPPADSSCNGACKQFDTFSTTKPASCSRGSPVGGGGSGTGGTTRPCSGLRRFFGLC